jgi:hypothetical protein
MTKHYIPKPSELPCFTVIEQVDGDPKDVYTVGDLYMRDSLGGWAICFPRDINHADAKEVRPADANARFDNFTIRALPVGYSLPKKPRPVLIWKDIPGFPEWQISNHLTIKNKRWPGYKRRTKDGDFILTKNGTTHRWHESQIGDAKKIKAFFSN